MEFIADIGAFLLKAIILVVALMLVISAVAGAAQKQKGSSKGELKLIDLSEQMKAQADQMRLQMLQKKQRKAAAKAVKQARKREQQHDQRLFVMDFNGSIDAKEVDQLRREVNAILQVATDKDIALIRLESGGGTVNGYGLGAAQLQRLKDHGMQVAVAVDKVAASGGYMMASVAHKIYAAPFALIGSVGVVAQIPNFHRFLKKHDVDYEQLTAGEYKRTLTLFGENTDEGRRKFKQDLEAIHGQFKAHIQQHRPELDIDRIATGEVWTGQQAIEQGLVDDIMTSDDVLMRQANDYHLYQVKYISKKALSQRLSGAVSAMVHAFIGSLKQP
ncbi:protease SohB [Idiomarina xiamenensis]|uniref:Inner membrane peptidase n=1 Tax=Idiomarina xiamenensis 10-D-4 TaxID=740709 RepID=K2L1Y4_9GAMM|nr:protease SohB [Idiomarina xiamenensis]EKE83865.1 inner membrane peptidase [Idiomarina xiamenensis 10-D-4]